MDEILASIRRIIESGEDRAAGEEKAPPAEGTAPAPVSTGAPPQPVAESRQPETSGAEAARFDIHYLPTARAEAKRDASDAPAEPRAELPSAPVQPTAAEAVQLRTSVEPDQAAQPLEVPQVGSAEIERSVADLSAEPAVAPVAGNENSSRSETPVAGATSPSSDFDFEFNDAQLEAALRSTRWDDIATPGIDEASQERTEARVPEPANSQDRRMPESVIDGASALLSAEAGDQVASAFGDLARAIREGHMRSMEEMAREMMRPMLQEWLDDNLPRIVERLVREEIERVARGARY